MTDADKEHADSKMRGVPRKAASRKGLNHGNDPSATQKAI